MLSTIEGSNPSLSATVAEPQWNAFAVHTCSGLYCGSHTHVPVAQGIERLVADQKVVGSIPAGHTMCIKTVHYLGGFWVKEAF